MPRHRKNKCRHHRLQDTAGGNSGSSSHFDGAAPSFIASVKRGRRRNQLAAASRRVNRQLAKGK